MPSWIHESDAAEYWERQANEARALATGLTSAASRRLIQQVADTYDRLAARAKEAKMAAKEQF
jgi:hypothetical protein